MSDLVLSELENIPWDEFDTSDDHIVPHHSVDQVNECVTPCNGYKKPRHGDIGKSVSSRWSESKTAPQKREGTYFRTPMKDEKCTLLEGSLSHASESVVPASSHKFIARETALASEASDECFTDYNLDAVSNKLHSKEAVPGSKTSIDGCRSSYLSLDEVLHSPINLDDLESDNKDKENDLMYHDLPDIGYFEDIDGMFRNCDATFEEGLTGADDLSWFSSSSNTLYGSEVTFESGLQSSPSKLSSFNSTSGHHLVGTNWSKSDQPAANHEKPSKYCYDSYPDWLDTDAENLRECPPHNNQISVHLKERQYPTEENKLQHHVDPKFLSTAVSTKACSSQHFPKRKHLLEPASSSFHISNRPAQVEYIHLVNQVPEKPSVKFECESDPSSSYNVPDSVVNYALQSMESFPDHTYKPPIVTQEKLENLHRHQLCSTVVPEHHPKQASFNNNVSTLKHHVYSHETRADKRIPNISLVPDGSFITAVGPDDTSVEATSFRQLQYVMDQLDVRTKLCIRDSLYRLARSAKRRHDSTDTNYHQRVSKDARGLQCTEAQKKCSEFIDDAETVTNPIDRSIAHLLFTGLPEPLSGSI